MKICCSGKINSRYGKILMVEERHPRSGKINSRSEKILKVRYASGATSTFEKNHLATIKVGVALCPHGERSP